jgi:hypothetical protein
VGAVGTGLRMWDEEEMAKAADAGGGEGGAVWISPSKAKSIVYCGTRAAAQTRDEKILFAAASKDMSTGSRAAASWEVPFYYIHKTPQAGVRNALPPLKVPL